ncbi:MAG: DUF2029 domain-containing protein [Anaerolineales bacterium]|nr:DUF2029 domain-containing protein [Anaerolineales bacterium]
MTQRQLAIVLIILTLVGFIIGSTYAIYDQELIKGSTDIYPTWYGAKHFWEDGLSPYDDRVGEASQQAIYGRPATATEDEVRFVYPLYFIFYFGPLGFLSFELAASIFMEILLLLMGATLALSLYTLRWLPKPLTLGISILYTLVSYFSVRGLLLGQPAFLAFGLHIGAYWAIAHRHDRAAGILLALSTIKPQTGYLIVPLLLLWAWQNDRRSIVYSFGSMFGALLGVSWILLPSWFGEWMERVFHYSSYVANFPTTHIISHLILPEQLGDIAQALLSIFILVPVAHFWWRAIVLRDSQSLLWGLMLTMAASLLISPRVATTSYVELNPVVYVALMFLEKRRLWGWLSVGTIAFMVAYWILHIATVPEEVGREAPIVYVVFPTIIYLWLLVQQSAWKDVDILKAAHGN